MFPLHFVSKGIRRRVLPTTEIPGNWQSFLRLDENERELFGFLANEVTKEETENLIISTIGSSVITNRSFDNVSTLCPSNHEEADTRMLLHAANASQSGIGKVMIRTVDTDVVVIALGMFSSLNLSELWISFGTGKNQRLLSIHSISDAIGATKCNGLPFFHAFTGCDQVSFFTGKGKESAWRTWKNFDDVTASFVSCSNFPSGKELKELFPTIDRYVTLLYDQSSLLESVNDCRKVLFATKGRSLEAIPPTHDALFQHTRRAIYQASCWRQSLIAQQNLPDPNAWGWHQDENGGFSIKSIAISQASAVCHELICCACNPEKGCKGRCKCKKSSLKCTAPCKFGGDCDDVDM